MMLPLLNLPWVYNGNTSGILARNINIMVNTNELNKVM